MTINLEKDQLCDWNDCVFYVGHKGSCRTIVGDFVNGPRATIEKCPCNNCSPLPSDSPIKLLWDRLCKLIRLDGRVVAMQPDYAKELQRAIDAYIYRNIVHVKHGELESIDDFMDRTSDKGLTNKEFELELLAREKALIEFIKNNK